jgi:hypothetical protein
MPCVFRLWQVAELGVCGFHLQVEGQPSAENFRLKAEATRLIHRL